jgi:hypothetical protein
MTPGDSTGPFRKRSELPVMSLPRPIPDALAELIAYRLRVLGQPVRIQLLDHLERDGEASVRALADEVGITPYNASQQLGVLRQTASWSAASPPGAVPPC